MAFRLGECLLRDRLEKVNMTQTELADRLGVSKQFVGAIISGRKKMSLELAINAAQLLECRVTDLYVLHHKPIKRRKRE